MSPRLSRLAALALLALLAACGEGNPLIGRWVLEPMPEDSPVEERAARALFALGGGAVEFTAETRAMGGEAERVTYEVEGGRVTVFNDRGRGTVYRVEGDRMVQSLPNPLGGEIELRFRRESASR